jgi:hypothetical protein
VIIPEGSHFCCLALTGPRLRVKQEYSVLPGLTVGHAQDAFELEPHWIEWLGTIQSDSFRESSLFITAVVDNLHTNTRGKPLPEFLGNRVRLFHYALAVLGCGYNDAALMVGGDKYHGGSLHIGPVRPGLTPCFRSPYLKSRRVEVSDLEQAATILSNLELIYDHVPGRLYRRLRKGFNVWIRGAQEGEEWNERLHSFVRATEAILKPTIARMRSTRARKQSKTSNKRWRDITPTFIERGQTMIGHSKKSDKLLRQLYDIRSSVEHIKDIMPAVKKERGIDSGETFGFRALQAEILANTIYSRILSNEGLLKAFSTEAKVEGFWNRIGPQRQSLWGDVIDLDAEARQVFASQVIPDFY